MNNEAKIFSCYMHEQPDFYREVFDGQGNLIATIRALSPADEDVIQRKSRMSINAEQTTPDYDMGAYENYHLLLSLGGTIGHKSFRMGEEGLWVKDACGETAVLNEENVNLLTPQLREIILQAIITQKKNWLAQREAILKN